MTASRTPSYRLHKPTGQAVVTLSGRDFYLGKHGSSASRDEYDRLVAEWLANGRRLTEDQAGRPLTIAELILEYWRHVERHYIKDGKPTSEPDTIRQALRFVQRLHATTPADRFGPLALRAVREAMIDHGLCRTYINRQINRVRGMFAWAASIELLPISVHQALLSVPGLRRERCAAREKPPVGSVADEVVERTLPYLGATVAAMVRLQRVSGMRPQEVTTIRPGDLDRPDDGCWVYRPGRHKSQHLDKLRTIFLGPLAQAVLAPYLEAATSPDAPLFSPRRAEADRSVRRRAARLSKLTPSQAARTPKPDPIRSPGHCYRVDSYRKAIRRACGRAGVELWTPHQLRHTAATEIRRKFGLEASQAVLGHSELATTQIYAEKDMSKAREVMAAIG